MPHSHTVLLLVTALAVSACKRPSEPAAAPAPAPGEPPVATRPAPEPQPASRDFALSFFQQSEAERCQWMRYAGPGATAQPAFTFPGRCSATHAAWSRDGSQGALLEYGEPAHAWQVELANGQGSPLPLPELPVTELGFTVQGELVALAVQHERYGLVPKQVRQGQQSFFVFEGERYPVPPPGEGVSGLAHTFALRGKEWKRLQTKATTFDAPGAPGTSALEAYGALGAVTNVPAPGEVQPEPLSAEEVAQLGLGESFPDKEHGQGGEWVQLPVPGGALVFWSMGLTPPVYTPPVRWRVEGALSEPEQLELPEAVSLEARVRGPAVLLVAERSVRLYDARQRKRVAAFEQSFRASFWPTPEPVAAAR